MSEHRAPPAVAPIELTPSPPNYASFHQLRSLTVGQSHLSTADLSDDARFVMVASEMHAAARLYSTETGKLVAEHVLPGDDSLATPSLALWPQSAEPRLVVGHAAGLQLVAPLTQQTSPLSDAPVAALQFSRDGRVLGTTRALGSARGMALSLFEATLDQRLLPWLDLECSERIEGWSLSPNREQLAVTFYPSEQCALFDLRNAVELVSAPCPRYTRSIDFSPDGRRFAVGGSELWLFESGATTPMARYTAFDNNTHAVRFSPDGRVVAVSAYDGRARLLAADPEGSSLRLVAELRHARQANVYAVDFSADGSRLVTSSGDKTVKLWGESAAAAARPR